MISVSKLDENIYDFFLSVTEKVNNKSLTCTGQLFNTQRGYERATLAMRIHLDATIPGTYYLLLLTDLTLHKTVIKLNQVVG